MKGRDCSPFCWGRISILLESNILHCRESRKTSVVSVLGVRLLDLAKQVASLVLLAAELLTPPSGMGTQRAGRPCCLPGFV